VPGETGDWQALKDESKQAEQQRDSLGGYDSRKSVQEMNTNQTD